MAYVPPIYEILHDFARKHPNVKVFQNDKNRGVNYTLNRGAELATGDYLLLSAADDEVVPGMFEKSLRLLAQYPKAALSCTVCLWRYEHSNLSWHMGVGMSPTPAYLSPEDLIRIGKSGKLLISSSSVIIRKDAFKWVGGLHNDLRWHADWFLSNAAAFRDGLCFVPEMLSVVNILPNSHYTAGREKPEHLHVLQRIVEMLNTPHFGEVRDRIKDSAALSLFGMPMMRVLRSKPEFKPYLTPAFRYRTWWRYAEVTGSRILPKWVAKLVLNTFYRLRKS